MHMLPWNKTNRVVRAPSLFMTGLVVALTWFANFAVADQSVDDADPCGSASVADASTARLRIAGNIKRVGLHDYIDVDMKALATLDPSSIQTSTVVTDGVLKFEGVYMRDLMQHAGAQGSFVSATALNGYSVDIPITDFHDFEVLLAWSMDGRPLQDDNKGPFWIVYPRDQYSRLQDIRYDYRWVWQLCRLQVK